MTSIVERLHTMENDMVGPYRTLTLKAANEIERLRAQAVTDWINHGEEIERLRIQLTLEGVAAFQINEELRAELERLRANKP